MKMKMWMWFHAEVRDQAMFESWKITDPGTMVWSCAVVVMWGIALEMVRWLRWVVQMNKTTVGHWYSPWISGAHWLDTFLFGLQSLLSLTLMLFFMTFSLWLCLSCSLGLAIGCYFFGARKLNN